MSKTKITVTVIISLLICALALYVYMVISGEKTNKRTRFLMDTYVTIQVPGKREVLKSIDKAMDKIEQLDVKFNPLNEKSQIYVFNKKGVPIDDPEIVALTKVALNISKLSDGDYDISLHELSNLWGFYSEKPRVPSPEEIKAVLKHTGYKKIYIKDDKIYKSDPLVQLDYGSIAKGYIVKQAVNILREEGITSALVDAGGDIYALGSLNGHPWKIGIRHPRNDGMIGGLDVTDKSVVSSGDYERYIIKDGRRYCHILSPKTGYSPQELISVTVISDDPALADAWSTAIFVMGAKRGIDIANKVKEIDAMVIDNNMKIYYSDNLAANTEHLKK